MRQVTVGLPDRALLRTGAPDLKPNVAAGDALYDEHGELILYVGRYTGDLAEYRHALRTFPVDTTVRMSGTSNSSRTFGYLSRREVLRRYACRSCGSALDAPEQHAIIAGAAEYLWAHFQSEFPVKAAHDLAEAQIIRPDWRLMDTPWTSGVVNFNSPLPYHFDANNLSAWSAMTVVRRNARGGHLHVPQLNAVVELRDGDVLYFPGYDLMHAVTPIRVKKDGYRITAVYYSIAAMAKCGPPENEVHQGARRRSEAEDGMLDRQRREGLLTDG